MHFTTVVTLLFAAFAAAAPRPLHHGVKNTVLPPGLTSEPDCAKMEDYCTSCGGEDFDCETNPSCEWCYENHRFGN
ncbi:Uu.00g036170.m01.CDS01 [Anthostomella pinea]|uniref:Uu.00g036170.m01.CDS01 n=1 Tax=Anthostomella pinea TaxID=933095 RepID=A0AAI8V9D7_9PEZI|nr:Uu.00g036170.m01.CDS01 [Anthostomella pinea]